MREEDQRGVIQGFLDRFRQALSATELLQIAKSVVAATLAWWISTALLDSQLPFLAPWTALLTVHLTVSRSIVRGGQTFISSAVGVLLSFLIGAMLGVEIWTYALALLVGLVLARTPGIQREGTAIATTAIFLLSQGFTADAPLLVDRITEVGVGVAVGVAVNLILVPPLRDRQAASLVDDLNRRTGEVLISMAAEFAESWETEEAEDWFRETDKMRSDLDETSEQVEFAQESRQRNPRRLLPRKQGEDYQEILYRVDEGVAHLRHLARTLADSSYSESEWDSRFREQWSRAARDAGHRIAHPDAEVDPIRDRLDNLTREMVKQEDLPDLAWPVYGSLIVSLRNIAVIVDDVASAREVRETEEN